MRSPPEPVQILRGRRDAALRRIVEGIPFIAFLGIRFDRRGDELTAVLTVTGIRSLGGNAMVTSEAEITDAAGAHVVTATSVLLVGEGE